MLSRCSSLLRVLAPGPCTLPPVAVNWHSACFYTRLGSALPDVKPTTHQIGWSDWTLPFGS